MHSPTKATKIIPFLATVYNEKERSFLPALKNGVSTAKILMRIEIIDAQEKDLPIVNNLFRLYYYDLSTVTDWNCPESGIFEGYVFGDLSRFWKDDGKYAFVVRVDYHLAGFVLIDNVGVNTLVDYNIAEFFILQKYRRKGVGTYVAEHIFDQFRGNWEVMQAPSHKAAQAFWRKVIAQYTSGNYKESTEASKNHGGDWVVQRFNNNNK